MAYKTVLIGGGSNYGIDQMGRSLRVIGNFKPYAGAVVWTDGTNILDFCQQADTQYLKPLVFENSIGGGYIGIKYNHEKGRYDIFYINDNLQQIFLCGLPSSIDFGRVGLVAGLNGECFIIVENYYFADGTTFTVYDLLNKRQFTIPYRLGLNYTIRRYLLTDATVDYNGNLITVIKVEYWNESTGWDTDPAKYELNYFINDEYVDTPDMFKFEVLDTKNCGTEWINASLRDILTTVGVPYDVNLPVVIASISKTTYTLEYKRRKVDTDYVRLDRNGEICGMALRRELNFEGISTYCDVQMYFGGYEEYVEYIEQYARSLQTFRTIWTTNAYYQQGFEGKTVDVTSGFTLPLDGGDAVIGEFTDTYPENRQSWEYTPQGRFYYIENSASINIGGYVGTLFNCRPRNIASRKCKHGKIEGSIFLIHDYGHRNWNYENYYNDMYYSDGTSVTKLIDNTDTLRTEFMTYKQLETIKNNVMEMFFSNDE